MAIVMPRSRSSGALSMLSKERQLRLAPASASVLVMAAVRRRLAVVDVPDRPHVHMRLRPLKLLLPHVLVGSFHPPWMMSYIDEICGPPTRKEAPIEPLAAEPSLEPTPGLEPGTSFLPRMCSTN